MCTPVPEKRLKDILTQLLSSAPKKRKLFYHRYRGYFFAVIRGFHRTLGLAAM